MSSGDYYRREIIKELAQGNSELIEKLAQHFEEEYETFDKFAQRTVQDEQNQLFGQFSFPDNIACSEKPLSQGIANCQPKERDDVARAFLNKLKQKGLNSRDLERLLSLSDHSPNRMVTDDVSKLAAFAYHNHPDVFQEVLADQPALVKFLSNPIVGAALGAIAAKWFSSRN